LWSIDEHFTLEIIDTQAICFCMFALRLLSRIAGMQSQSEVQIFVPRSTEIDWPRSKALLPVETTLFWQGDIIV
jgi:hypothetical protein